MFIFYRFYRGRPFFSTISAVKTEKIENLLFLPLLRGGGAPFSSTISAVKTVKVKTFLFLPFLPGGRSFFFYHIRGKNGKNRKFLFFFFLPFFLRGRKRMPLSKTTLANQLSERPPRPGLTSRPVVEWRSRAWPLDWATCGGLDTSK